MINKILIPVLFLNLFSCSFLSFKRPLIDKKKLCAKASSSKLAFKILKQINFYGDNERKALILLEDLITLYSLEEKHPSRNKKMALFLKVLNSKIYINFLLKMVKAIDFSPTNCSTNQLACTFPTYPHKIFISSGFWNQPIYSRLSTLLHEAVHHLKSYKHKLCTNPRIYNMECDENNFSPYGIEKEFLTYLINNHFPKNDSLRKEHNAATARVNKSSKD